MRTFWPDIETSKLKLEKTLLLYKTTSVCENDAVLLSPFFHCFVTPPFSFLRWGPYKFIIRSPRFSLDGTL